MAHHRRQVGSACAARRGRGPFQPRDANQRPPAQTVDLMKTVYPDEDYDTKSLALSIVPEVDEEEEEKVVDTLSDVFPHPGESPKTSKRMLGLIELVLDVAFLMRRRVKARF